MATVTANRKTTKTAGTNKATKPSRFARSVAAIVKVITTRSKTGAALEKYIATALENAYAKGHEDAGKIPTFPGTPASNG